jgi:hypothetical protein
MSPGIGKEKTDMSSRRVFCIFWERIREESSAERG